MELIIVLLLVGIVPSLSRTWLRSE